MPLCIFPLNNANEKRERRSLIPPCQEEADFPLRLNSASIIKRQCASPVFLKTLKKKWWQKSLNSIYSFDEKISRPTRAHALSRVFLFSYSKSKLPILISRGMCFSHFCQPIHPNYTHLYVLGDEDFQGTFLRKAQRTDNSRLINVTTVDNYAKGDRFVIHVCVGKEATEFEICLENLHQPTTKLSLKQWGEGRETGFVRYCYLFQEILSAQ